MARTNGDVVVLLPGISGSVLSKDGKEIWGTSAGALWRAVETAGQSFSALTLAGDDPADDLGDGIVATRLIPDIHIIPGLWKIDGYSKIADQLVASFRLKRGENFFEFPYDWRRDNRVAARKLEHTCHVWLAAWRERSGNRDAKLVLVVHSMGGLVARYFLEVLEGWRITRSLVSVATPYRGSLNALGYIVNGYSKGIGPFKADLSSILRSCTSIYQLLPTFKSVDTKEGELRRVADCSGLRNLDTVKARAALAFHAEIRNAQARNAQESAYVEGGYTLYPVVGIQQPTFQSARIVAGGTLELLRDYEGKDYSGDGTVPRASATPIELEDARREMFAADCHGSLQNAIAVLDHVQGVISGADIDFGKFRKLSGTTLSLDLDDVYPASEVVSVRVKASEGSPHLVGSIVDATNNRAVDVVRFTPSSDGYELTRFALPPGAYRLTVSGDGNVKPVTDTFLVAAGGAGFSKGSGRGSGGLGRDVYEEPRQRRRGATAARVKTKIGGDLDIAGPAGMRDMALNRDARQSPESASDEGATVVRYPSVEPAGLASVGQGLDFVVDLKRDPRESQTEGKQVIIDAPQDWESLLVEIELQSSDVDFGDKGIGSVEVRRNSRSAACLIHGMVRANVPADRLAIEVIALFSYRGRFCGFGRRSIPLAASDSRSRGMARAQGAGGPASNPSGSAAGDGSGDPGEPIDGNAIEIEGDAEGPDLTVRIFHPNGTGEGCYLWSLGVRNRFDGLPSNQTEMIDLGKGADVFAKELLRKCADQKPGEHMGIIAGVGQMLWERAPEVFRKTYWAMHAKLGGHFSIQFISEDPYVPWELMQPHDDDDDSKQAEIIALAHPVARWIARQEGRLRNRLPSGTVVSVAPVYPRPDQYLEFAQKEAKTLEVEFDAERWSGTYDEFKRLLVTGWSGKVVALLHFAGHGEFDAVAADLSRLLLEDRPISVPEVRHTDVKLGIMDRSMVVLNACQVGATATVLGAVGGWAEALGQRRFSGVLAPLWSVCDEISSKIAVDFIRAVYNDRKTAGEALRSVRESYKDDSSTPFAYILYGDVMARVQR